MIKLENVFGAGAALIGSLAIAGAAGAVTYDAVSEFSSSNPSGVWSYGYGATGTSFDAYPSYLTDDFGTTGLDGYSVGRSGTVPVILQNYSGSTVDFANTVVLPTGLLLLHPGARDSEDSIIRFTAPTTAEYNVAGFFQTLDTSPTGVTLIAADSDGVLRSQNFLGSPAMEPGTPGGTYDFDADIVLHAGEWLEIGVNRDANYTNDSTGLSLNISTVPEPAAWALMLVGFGALGAVSRRRRRALAA